MYGTKIFEPLDEIFKQKNQMKIANLETQIYLLTDGAVSNSSAVIDLVR